ncbi:protein PsiE, partial [Acinetobacter baumannii]
VIITGSILILAISILVVRFASWHYPSVMKEKHSKTPNSLKTPQPQDDELA